MRLNEHARAKVNLTLAVLGRRADGYHVLDSLVAFADVADSLSLEVGPDLSLEVSGPRAEGAGALADNLVLKAANALASRFPGLVLGHFHLMKALPAAAGLGGGSSDAAAALRLLARANKLALTHDAVVEAARATGSDVPVCLEARSRWMRGAGEILSEPVALPPLPALLVNPGVATPTAEVFRALAFEPGHVAPYDEMLPRCIGLAGKPASLVDFIASGRNDLQPPAIALRPVIGEAIEAVGQQPGCRLARMSGSGATVFGLFDTREAAKIAAEALRPFKPGWWIVETSIG
ncbi:4-diphosphocytidyl-2-C-methyl-D-erythritol kinase [Labrys miyagiensis]|uniref:4-diphosphocytidyl-2-C-methyl-D-erythritol kinase n=1 Tax=Labrys miyagiensis TaxID=346912 RepID=A0ABQ6CUR8_9HYPH|nr:4-(cytidine 5'-diphospho)-2-C-methyl-D-erythritol kinase [Labrys miyagiensis]GLS24058.1 4-diphosphocytidyl-2-C-methyl-D-erythritol kinase [Labrys miyagiensis]